MRAIRLLCFRLALLVVLLTVIELQQIHALGAEQLTEPRNVVKRATIRFPEDNTAEGGTSKQNNFDKENAQFGNSRADFSRTGKISRDNVEQAQGALRKTERKAKPDVQDIISGIVSLLGGKVNLHAASGVDIEPDHRLSPPPQSTRINNRGPPREPELPESVSAEDELFPSKPQLPPGVPLRRPIFPPVVNPGTNLQQLPFAAGIPLPVQLVPPVNNSALPALPNTIPLRTTTVPNEESNSSDVFTAVAEGPTSVEPDSKFPEESSYSEIQEVSSTVLWEPSSSVNFATSSSSSVQIQLSSSGVQPATEASSVLVHQSSVQPVTEASSIVVHETSSIEAILQPSIEDIAVTQTGVSALVPSSHAVSSSEETSKKSASAAFPASVSVDPSNNFTPPIDGGLRPPAPSSSSPTPPLRARPGQVFNEKYTPPVRDDVITGEVFPESAMGETFELVVTAAQNYGGGGPQLDGRPYLISGNKGHVGNQGDLITTALSESDQYVSIDGKRTYFNLDPTETLEVGTPSRPPVVQNTQLPQRLPQTGVPGSVFVASVNDQPVRPANRPNYPPQPLQKPTAPPARKPPALPPSSDDNRIDACIVGDSSTCSDPNETCRTEDFVSACSCKGGYGRRKSADKCIRLAGFVVSVKVDRLDAQQLRWSYAYTNPDSPEYRQLEWESSQAVNSLLDMTPLSNVFVTSAINSFFVEPRGMFINATLFFEQTPQTLSDVTRSQIQKLIYSAIIQRNNNIGTSRLWINDPTNAVLAIQDLNECESPDLNDCDENAFCTNTAGSYQCHCPSNLLDPFMNDPGKAGRKCESCGPSDCNNRGECQIERGQKICHCKGSFKGSKCEIDSEVLGVATGASVAAVVIIALTLVILCWWSRRWRQNQNGADAGFMNAMNKGMPLTSMMQDHIRWTQMAEAMAPHNVYAAPAFAPYYYQAAAPAMPPPLPPREKPSVRQVSSLPVSLGNPSFTTNMVGAFNQLMRRLSKKQPSQKKGDTPSHDFNFVGQGYPPGYAASLGRSSLVPPFPLAPGQHHGYYIDDESFLKKGKPKRVPPPPPHGKPPNIPDDVSEESSDESDDRQRSSRSRSRAFRKEPSNIYSEPGTQFRPSLSTQNGAYK